VSGIRKSYWFPAIIAIFISLSLVTFSSDIVTAEDEIQVFRGSTITITVTILQNGSYGTPVQNQRIHFFDQTANTLLGSAVSNQNGIVSLDWEIPVSHTLGLTILNATFYGNESLSLSPSYQRVSLLVLSQTRLETDPISGTLAPGDLLSLNVHLVDDSNTSIPNAELTVFKDTTVLTTGITNLSGYALFEIECNSTWISLGENNIRILYNQDLINFLDGTEFAFNLDIAQIPTFLNFDSPYPNVIELNTIIDLYMTLSEGNNTLPGEILEVTLDVHHLSFIISNSSGKANFYTTIDERFSLGTHSLKIRYNGTYRYSQSTLEILVSVTSPVTITAKVPDFAEIGSNLPVQITVADLLNRSIPNSIFSLYDMTSDQSFSGFIEDTVIDFQYDLQGPPGEHTLTIEILENPFISENRFTLNFTAWSRPEIIFVNTSVDHYASPNQELTFEVRVVDWNGNCSLRTLQLLIDNDIYTSSSTDSDGLAIFIFSSPANEAQYNISIIYNGNSSRYELTTKHDYNLFVTSFMPITIELNSYEVVAPLHELSVQLTVRGLNGSLLSGVRVNFNWLSSDSNIESFKGGLIILHLTIPTVSGSYALYYESESTRFIDSTSGSIFIEITMNDIMSIEGVGITGMIFALIASIGIVSVPLIRRRYLVG
jgi:hypothetical protein